MPAENPYMLAAKLLYDCRTIITYRNSCMIRQKLENGQEFYKKLESGQE